MMEQIEKQGLLASSLPILQRLDRLERLVQFLEKKKSMSGTGNQYSTLVMAEYHEEEDKLITLSSALEEVHYKGTLLERLEMLEKRVLQMSMEIDRVNKLTSSFSSFAHSEQLEHSTTLSKSDDDSVKENGIEVNCEVSAKSKMRKRRASVIRPKKWLGLLSLRACRM